MDTNENPSLHKTKEETDKKCPNCGATLNFDPKISGLFCEYCGYQNDISEAEEKACEELDFESAEEVGNFDWGVEKKLITCKSCGAEIIYDSLDLASECPYCGSNHVLEEKDAKSLAPGGVCPFKIDKNTATFNFKRWIKKRIFCPRKAKKLATPEAFNGSYLPFWTFDTDTSSFYTARYGRDRRVRDRDGNTRIVTDWRYTRGYYEEFINDELVLASKRHDEYTMSKIEPYDTEANVTYKPEYIAGFKAEKYSVGLKDGWENAREHIAPKLRMAISSKIRRQYFADHVDIIRVNTTFSNITYKYLLLPVWCSSFKYKNKTYSFMINGQTGRVGGKTPISILRVLIAISLFGLFAFALFCLSEYIA